ncbi:hypothetical protein V8C86DRAFT_2470475 [Haematococcus lacustris]
MPRAMPSISPAPGAQPPSQLTLAPASLPGALVPRSSSMGDSRAGGQAGSEPLGTGPAGAHSGGAAAAGGTPQAHSQVDLAAPAPSPSLQLPDASQLPQAPVSTGISQDSPAGATGPQAAWRVGTAGGDGGSWGSSRSRGGSGGAALLPSPAQLLQQRLSAGVVVGGPGKASRMGPAGGGVGQRGGHSGAVGLPYSRGLVPAHPYTGDVAVVPGEGPRGMAPYPHLMDGNSSSSSSRAQAGRGRGLEAMQVEANSPSFRGFRPRAAAPAADEAE